MNSSNNATGAQYQEQFNKQLAEQLSNVRKAQPNHIPVYAMKYKNASKYFVEDLEEPLALIPKKFKLKSLSEIIQKQSLKFCHDKLKEDKKMKQQGSDFKLPTFYLYTISMIQENKHTDGSQNPNQGNSTQKPIGIFVKLDLETTFQQAFEKYGRQNVLTVVYTDAAEVQLDYKRSAATTVEKWLTRIIIFILILVLIPFLMKNEEQKFQTTGNAQSKQKAQEKTNISSIDKIDLSDTLDLQNTLDIDISESGPIAFSQENTFEYDEQTV